MATGPETHSLRERKRRATMAAIEDAATTLVLDHGYDAVTVDQICAHADVSKRTFFNYVPTKEAAVVGTSPESVPAEVRDRFLDTADPDVATAVLRVNLASFAAMRTGDGAHAVALVQRRREIVRRDPELAAARMTASSRFQLVLVGLVTEHFRRHPSLRRLAAVSAEDEARATVALVVASTGLGVSAWLDRDTGTFDDLDDDCVAGLRQLTRLVVADPTTSGRTT